MTNREVGRIALAAATKQAKHEGRLWLFFIPMIIILWMIFPRFETRYFPVVTEAEILSIHSAAGGWSRVEIESDKLRNCNWRRIKWFYGSRTGLNVPVDVYFEDAPAIRSPGRLHWDGLMVRLDVEEIPKSFGDVLHECYGPDHGMTRSNFFTGEEAQ